MQKRLRIFAGPNGSGKSSIIESILEKEVQNGRKLDFGIYVNADDIASQIRTKPCRLDDYSITTTLSEFLEIANKSGLVHKPFSLPRLIELVSITNNVLQINHSIVSSQDDHAYERVSQIIADFLRKKLLADGKKFSFETVFSHFGKVDFIREAKNAGYKVYLYFVSTESPEINIYRVKTVRVGKNGHDVEKDKIIERYYRSMNNLYEASQHCYQVYFFDNSKNESRHNLFAHFKLDSKMNKNWNVIDTSEFPNWFSIYYSSKITETGPH